ILSEGMPYRLTESDDCLKGVPNASDSFASALWALDYLHWWAAHGASGVNFHNTEWLTTDTVYYDPAADALRIHPKAYAIKAFDLGCHGRVAPLTIASRGKLDLTAYAVWDTNDLYVTIIDKDHGKDALPAAVTIRAIGFSTGRVETMNLLPPDGNVGATNGITLGGAPITNHAPWRGRWRPLETAKSGCAIVVAAGSAAIVKIPAR
ncbi:MAG: hypothetical protein ACREE6_07065, partial [Limisphaerales bacterium]